METKIKNIFVLVLVFTAISIITLWLITPDKGGNAKVAAGSWDTLRSSVKASPPETDDQVTVMTRNSAEAPEAAVALGRGEIESTAATEEVDQQAGDAAAHLALGIESYKRDDLQKALSHFQEALRLEPGNSTAQQLIAKVSREAKVEASFNSKEGSHFNVKYEGGESDVAGHVVAMTLEEAYHKVGSDLGFYPDDSITTILYSAEQFMDVTRAPAWSGGIYDGKIRIPVGGLRERTEVLEKVIFHEYAHAVVHRMGGGRVPVWLNEGIAQYEDGRNEGRDDMFRYLASAEKLVPLKYLEGSYMGLNQNQAIVAYAEALSAVKYIVDEYGMGILTGLLSSYRDGKGSERAIKDTFQMTYDEFQESWIRNLKKRYGS